MREMRILIPMPRTDSRLVQIKQKYADMHRSLEFEEYADFDAFLTAHGITNYESY